MTRDGYALIAIIAFGVLVFLSMALRFNITRGDFFGAICAAIMFGVVLAILVVLIAKAYEAPE